MNHEETVDHLFCSGSWARNVWNFMHSSFGIAKPRCVRDIIQHWVGSKEPSNLLSGVRLGLVCLLLWEIWRARNAWIHDGQKRNIINEGMRWIATVRSLINLPHVGGNAGRLCLARLGVTPDIPQGRWVRWLADQRGFTVNVAMVTGNSNSKGGFVIRDRQGVMKLAGTCSFDSYGLHALIQTLEYIINLCNQMGMVSFVIQSSNIHLGDLFFAKEETLDYHVIYLRRRFRAEFSNISIHRINASQNNVALAIAFKGSGLYFDSSHLPGEARRALQDDIIGLPNLSFRFHSE